MKVRFAPSPTGYLHVGNIRIALINWMFARKQQGQFVLRIDDTDHERSTTAYAQAIEEDLQWLGLNWDVKERQSDRFTNYEAAKQTLLASGRLYPCYETAEELEVRRKMQASRGLPPIYDRAALKLSDEQKHALEAQGRKPHYRFLLEDKMVGWHDLIRGKAQFRGTSFSDPVLIREDGVPLYTLASVVDDGEMGITHIIRGEDHVSNTAVQVQIFEALGFTPPQFAHTALLKTKDGELSKRLGGFDIRSLRERGVHPMAVNSLIARIGTSDPVEPISDMAQLIASFDMGKLGRAPANYDVEELERLNVKILHHLNYDEAKAFIPEEVAKRCESDFWLAVRGNLASIADLSIWLDICRGELPPAMLNAEERQFVAQAAALLPSGTLDESSWDAWIAAIKPTTDRKGKALFLPLRLALTGRDDGPELKKILPLLGRERILTRLKG